MTKDRLLTGYTGLDSKAWIELIEKLIRTYFDAEPDNPHPECDDRWIHTLVSEVHRRHRSWMSRPRRFERWRKPRTPYDENISTALILATILSTWAVRLSRAKAHDSRRPLDLRRRALAQNRSAVAALQDAIFDESRDAEYFDLPWQYPYAADATSGSFV